MPPQDPLVGRVLAERFEILSRIGEGGTGVVYKARQLSVDRTVAIKILGAHVSQDPSWVKRFHNEARAAARLEHPNTVRLIDFGETKEGLMFIAMEFLQGRPLADEISRIGRLPPPRMLNILKQMCSSLSEAHGQGIIHRDIKPDNVFLMEVKGGDFVKVLDFSVAKIDTPDAQATRAGTVFGTPAYMSPEQGRGIKLTPQSDLYSCGIVAYEMLTGKPPFEARLPMEVVMAHLRQKPPPLTGFPEPVQNLVMRALEKTPERRLQSAEEMARECDACLEQLMRGSTAAAPLVGASQALPLGAPPAADARMTGAAPPPAGNAGMNAGMAGAMPPPVGAPPPVGQPPPVAAPEQRTVLAQAPNLSPGATGNLGGQSAGQRTVAFNPEFGGTVMMPDGPGISPAALVAQRQAQMQGQQAAKPVSPLFWVGWVLIGLSVGLAMHFWWGHTGSTEHAGREIPGLSDVHPGHRRA